MSQDYTPIVSALIGIVAVDDSTNVYDVERDLAHRFAAYRARSSAVGTWFARLVPKQIDEFAAAAEGAHRAEGHGDTVALRADEADPAVVRRLFERRAAARASQFDAQCRFSRG